MRERRRRLVVVLISGRGSNLRAILESPVGEAVAAVVSDREGAGGLAVAREFGKAAHACRREAYPTRGDFEGALARQLDVYRPALVALAGFMRVLSGEFVARYRGRLVNIHPSLLPRFPGLDTHRRALAAGAREHGCSAHWVSAEVDGGAVIARERVLVRADDNAETLAARVLAAEHRLYPKTLARLLAAGGGE